MRLDKTIVFRRPNLGGVSLVATLKEGDDTIVSLPFGFLSGVAFAIFYATLGVPMAMWADRGNRRNLIALALATWSGMTAVCGMATNFWQLALARIGVGIGEAGSSPPSHSMIADMYPPAERAGAMGTFSLGINLGLMTGFLVGGWISQWYGWRAAFYVVGLPGLLLALVVRLTLREPPRGSAEGLRSSSHEAPSLGAIVRFMASTPTLRHLATGATLASFVGYGVVLWLPAFLMRSTGYRADKSAPPSHFCSGSWVESALTLAVGWPTV